MRKISLSDLFLVRVQVCMCVCRWLLLYIRLFCKIATDSLAHTRGLSLKCEAWPMGLLPSFNFVHAFDSETGLRAYCCLLLWDISWKRCESVRLFFFLSSKFHAKSLMALRWKLQETLRAWMLIFLINIQWSFAYWVCSSL